MHAVILDVLKMLFILVCRSKSPTGLMVGLSTVSITNGTEMYVSIVTHIAMNI